MILVNEMQENQQNPMREIKIEKLTLNVGCGDDQQKIERAKKLLEMLTQRKPVITLSKKRSTFGVTKNKPIGVKVTLRKKPADEFLRKVLQVVDNKVRASQLDGQGNLNIGVKEYIELPSVKYSHDIGMFGFGVSVTLKRSGHRISGRKIQKRQIPQKQKISREEALEWLRKNYGTEIVGN